MSAVGVIGEVLITVGVVMFLYVAWFFWIGDAIQGAENNAAGAEQAAQWDAPVPTSEPGPSATPEPTAEPEVFDPVVAPQPGDGEVFGVMYVPRFGKDYAVRMAGGVSRSVTLDPIGIGHYPDTAMAGEVGNFAVAAHRTTWGKPFAQIADLRINDAIVIKTPDGWYTYRFRNLEYVHPNAVDVLSAVPQSSAEPDGARYLTMTSCSPMYSQAERIVAYAVFESFQPLSAGTPSALAKGA